MDLIQVPVASMESGIHQLQNANKVMKCTDYIN